MNSFALRADNNGEEENVGTALYRANSIFDHSCRPNATTIFSGKKLYIKSLISMASLELSKFYISYLDQSLSRNARSEWSTLIGPDPRDTLLYLVEPYNSGAKVYAITTHTIEGHFVPFGVLLWHYK